MEGRSRRVESGRRTHRAPEGRRRRHGLHARKPDRNARWRSSARSGPARRGRWRGRAVGHRHHRLESSWPGRDRRTCSRTAASRRCSRRSCRRRPAFAAGFGGAGRGSGSAMARAADPASVVRQHRRARPRDVLPGERSTGAGASLQQRAGGTRLRRVERRRAARRGDACSSRPRASRASPSSRSRTWTTRSACSWCRSCSTPCLRWTRRQSGTSSLRALLYMDEVFGYLPPVANPPSKLPLLTLLKQARAFGVGAGAGDAESRRSRLQGAVEHRHLVPRQAADRARQGARARRPRRRVVGSRSAGHRSRAVVAQKRVFLMHNVHEQAPVAFETRWALSYLRGPMGREELRRFATAPPRALRPRRRRFPERAPPPPALPHRQRLRR